MNSSESFIGFFFRAKDSYFGFYEVSLNLDDKECISIMFEGGYLFSFDGEEAFYSLDDVPHEAKILIYKNANGIPDISGLMSAYAIKKLFPSLPDPENVLDKSGESLFLNLVTEQFNKNKWVVY
jgi:hypothetical protein